MNADDVYAILAKRIKNGGITQEQIQNAVNDYFSKNPIKPYELPVMTETQLGGAKAVEKTTENVPVAIDENGQLYVPESEASGNIKIVSHGTSDTTFALTANTYHKWGEVVSLDLTLAEGEEGVANVYWFSFDSGATATQLTLPESIQTDLIVQPNTHYEISIMGDYMLYSDWSVSV